MSKECKRGDVLVLRWRWVKNQFRFRIDPVPHTSKHMYGFSLYRNAKGHKQRHMDSAQWMPWQDDTAKPVLYRNAKVQELWDSDYWGEYSRTNYNSSWKQNKKRKQWM